MVPQAIRYALEQLTQQLSEQYSQNQSQQYVRPNYNIAEVFGMSAGAANYQQMIQQALQSNVPLSPLQQCQLPMQAQLQVNFNLILRLRDFNEARLYA